MRAKGTQNLTVDIWLCTARYGHRGTQKLTRQKTMARKTHLRFKPGNISTNIMLLFTFYQNSCPAWLELRKSKCLNEKDRKCSNGKYDLLGYMCPWGKNSIQFLLFTERWLVMTLLLPKGLSTCCLFLFYLGFVRP